MVAEAELEAEAAVLTEYQLTGSPVSNTHKVSRLIT